MERINDWSAISAEGGQLGRPIRLNRWRMLIIFIFGVAFNLFPTVNSLGQQFENEFDSIYHTGLVKIPTDLRVAEQCLKDLASYQKDLTPIQKARINSNQL